MNKFSKIVKFIYENPNDWRDKLDSYNIRVKEENHLAIFNYNINADFHNPLVQEARGIIINLLNLEVVCWPFRKFGNHFEDYVDEIDWSTAIASQKRDGSIMKLYYYDNKWRLATNGCINAETALNYENLSFAELFNEGGKALDYDRLNYNYTYIFELTSPKNRIVLDYAETEIYHIGTRCNKTGEEIDVYIGVPHPEEYEVRSLSEVVKLNKQFSHLEGWVVRDANYNRIKVKTEYYVELHHSVTNLTDNMLKEAVIEGTVDDLLGYLSDFHKNKVAEIKKTYDDATIYLHELKNKYHMLKSETKDKKEYAERVKGDKYNTLAFKIYDNKVTNIDINKYYYAFFEKGK